MLAIIPARGGSKGLPKKNIKDLGGKPLIHWTIDAAIKSSEITKIILSTDDEEIVDTCLNKDIEIPFMRPKDLADDNSSAIDVYIYTMERLKNENLYEEDDFVVLLPTVPFVTCDDIDNAVKLFRNKNADSVVSTTKLHFPKEWIFDVEKDSNLIKKTTDNISVSNRQSFKSSFIPNGGIYVLKHSLVKKERTYYFNNTYSYDMPNERSIDIDTLYDFKLAQFLAEEERC